MTSTPPASHDFDYPRWARVATSWTSPDDRARVPIHDTGEDLVSLAEACPAVRVAIRSAPRQKYAGGDYLQVRESVAVRLNHIADLVSPYRLSVFDAFRPLAYQRWRFQQVMTEKLRVMPWLTKAEALLETDAQVAWPDPSGAAPPPHSTGGAVDMLLLDDKGTAVDFGSTPGLYNEAGQDERHPTNSGLVTPAQRRNRMILLDAAVSAGLANFPGEWWHYSYGDQDWAAYTRRSDIAIFGAVETDAAAPVVGDWADGGSQSPEG